LAPFTKLFARTPLVSQAGYEPVSVIFIIKLRVKQGGKHLILCDKVKPRITLYMSHFRHDMMDLSICVFPCVAENINPVLVYVFSDTKIMRRESAGVWHSFSM